MPHQCTNCGRTFPDGSKEMLSGCPTCGGNKFQFKPSSAIDDSARASTDTDTDTDTESRTDTPPTESREDTRSAEWYEQREDGEADGTSSPAPSTTADASSGDARSTGRDEPGRGDVADDAEEIVDEPGDKEDAAQADARSAVVDEDELAASSDSPPAGESSPSHTGDAAPDPDAGGDPETDAGREAEPTADDETAAGEETARDRRADQPDISDLRDELNQQFESIRIVNPGEYELNLMELYDRKEYIISLREDGRYVIEMPEHLDRDLDDE